MNRWMLLGVVLCAGTSVADVGDQLHKLHPTIGRSFEWFGQAVAVDGGLAAVGSKWHDGSGEDSGAAYVFDVATGQQLRKLVPSGGAYSYMGTAIAIYGQTIIAGAYGDGTHGASSGAVYIFDAVTLQETGKLTPADGNEYGFFGDRLATDGEVVAVGATGDDAHGLGAGAVYVFELATQAQRFKLTPGDIVPDDAFGGSVALGGGVVVAGAPGDDDRGDASGSAYAFDLATGGQLRKLVPGDGVQDDRFGLAAATDGNIAIIGSANDDDSGDNSGSVYIFDIATGAQLAKLVPPGGSDGAFFGRSIVLRGGLAAVGAPGQSRAYLFDVSDPVSPALVAEIQTADGSAGDQYGCSVGLSGELLAVGALGDDERGTDAGAAYLFDVGMACAADFNGDGVVDTRDFVAFLNAWAAADASADFDGNGVIDTRDFIAYLNLWAAGC